MNKSPFKLNGDRSYRVENKASDEATVYIYDEISYWGVDANQFAKDFNAIKAKTIHVRVNSPGGSVFDGLAIFNTIQQHKSTVIAHIDGLAASIASVLVLAADEVQMAKNAFYMIHQPWSMVIGTSEDMRKEADLIDKVDGSIIQTYVDKTGKKESEIVDMMNEETWLTAEEALEMGFADSIFEDKKEETKDAMALFDLSLFAKVPDKIKNQGKELTAREMEKALRDAGCTGAMAKSILSNGLKSEQRDVAEEEVIPVEDAEQRDVAALEQSEPDLTAVLLNRASELANPKPIEEPTEAVVPES